MSTSLCNKKPGGNYQIWDAAAGNCVRQLPAHLARTCQGCWRRLEVLHGVEYLEAALRAGQLKITKPVRKKLLITIPAIWGEVAAYSRRRAPFYARFSESSSWETRGNQRWAWCCGGVPEADPNLAQGTASDRVREAKETGAELILTQECYASAPSLRLNSLLCRPKN